MKKTLLILLFIIIGCGGDGGNIQSLQPQYRGYTIKNVTPGGEISINATEQYAGAINSLTHNGKEFISATCTGDLLQSASSFVYGEGYNPTEAGTARDGMGPSSSILRGISAEGNVLKTQSQMAFYMSPGDISAPAFGDKVPAMNTTVLSNHILTKQVTIGHPSSPHVIEYIVNFYVAEDNASGTFEILTGYLLSDFNNFWIVDFIAGNVSQLINLNAEQPLPLIISTADDYAMGVYCPILPQPEFPLYGYGSFVPPYIMAGETKWNVVYRVSPAMTGNYSFTVYLIVGTMDEVKIAMMQLYNHLKGD